MKKISFSLNILLITIILLLVSFNLVSGDNYTVGSETDPVVTKSYVDNAISKIQQGGGGSSSSVKFEVIKVSKDNVITLEENALLIVRAGETSAIASEQGGLSDLTTALDIKTGEQVELNHLILIPRTDGRGIKMKSDGYIMVSGGYSIK